MAFPPQIQSLSIITKKKKKKKSEKAQRGTLYKIPDKHSSNSQAQSSKHRKSEKLSQSRGDRQTKCNMYLGWDPGAEKRH